MSDNFWLGSNELVIVERPGFFAVLEAWENCEEVFRGSYAECRAYCKKRLDEYEESLF